MDLKQLLGKLDLLEGTMSSAEKNPTGPKFTGQWKGTDKGLPGRKLVGDSILKDLSKGPSPKTKEQELAEQFEQFLQQLEEENLGVEEKRPSRKGSRPARDYGKDGEPSKRYKKVEESAEELNVGDDVIITGSVEHQGETGIIDSFGQDKRFVVVNLYNHGKKSFHSSDVSYNDYADSDAEEAEMYDRDPDFRNWAAKQDIDESIDDGEMSSQELRDRMSSAISAHDEETADWGNPGFARHFGKTSLQSALNRKYGILKALKDKSLPLAQRLKFKDLLKDIESEIEDLQMAESQGDPHKILMNKLRDIERKPSTPSAEDEARRAEQAKADYKKYVEKMKKKNPNFIPLYKIDEYGADQPTGTAGQTNLGSTTQPNQAQQAQKAKEVAQATQTLKAATGATVPTTNLAKAIDAASKGTAVDAQSMKALEPIMKDVAAVASDPKLASQFKSLASQINQTQAKQAQQKT